MLRWRWFRCRRLRRRWFRRGWLRCGWLRCGWLRCGWFRCLHRLCWVRIPHCSCERFCGNGLHRFRSRRDRNLRCSIRLVTAAKQKRTDHQCCVYGIPSSDFCVHYSHPFLSFFQHTLYPNTLASLVPFLKFGNSTIIAWAALHHVPQPNPADARTWRCQRRRSPPIPALPGHWVS